VAGLHVALGAGLVAMVCALTIGKPRYAQHEQALREARATADALRARALALAGEDAQAYAEVSAAFRLPKGSPRRAAALDPALRRATDVPLRTVGAAGDVLDLCADVFGRANRTVLTDLGVAAHSARAGAESAALNVRVNLGLIDDGAFVTATSAALDARLEAVRAAADQVVERVERNLADAAA
jgi:formiminotetrahydrofolate cyclodeaminase